MEKQQTCTRRLEFDAAHRVMRHESKCASLHGHRYVLEVTCRAVELDTVGRVVDFGQIKAVFGKWIDDNLDHTTLVNREDTSLKGWVMQAHLMSPDSNKTRKPYVVDGEPTAEVLANHLFWMASAMLNREGMKVCHMRVYETPNCYADYECDDPTANPRLVDAERALAAAQ